MLQNLNDFEVLWLSEHCEDEDTRTDALEEICRRRRLGMWPWGEEARTGFWWKVAVAAAAAAAILMIAR